MGIKAPNELKEQKQELSEQLEKTQAELKNKENELAKAGNENKEKSALIEELNVLQQNTEDYKKQIASINAELATLRDKTQNNGENISNEPTTKQPTSEVSSEKPDIKLDSYEGYNKTLSQLIFEIDGCTETAKYKQGLNKSGKETLKTAKAKLKQYKDIISDKKRMLEHEFKEKNKLNEKNPDKTPLTLSISGAEINELKNRRFNWRQLIETDIKEGQMGKSSNIAPWPNQSLEQVIKGNRVDTHHIEYDSKLNEALNDAAFLRIIDNKQDKAREFLQAIANNSLSDAQITICQTRMVQLAPYFEKYGMTEQVNRCIIQSHGGRIETVQGAPRNSIDYSNMDFGEAFQQGGIIGLVDKGLNSCKNMTPGQRNAWKSVAILGGYAAGIYGLFKFFTNKKMSFWSKALTTGGVILGSQMLTGENPITLFQRLLTGGFTKDYLESKFGNTFGDAVNGVGNSGIEVSNTITPAMYSFMIFNPSTTVKNVRDMTSRFENKNEWKIFRSTVIEKLENKYGKNSAQYFSTNFPETFDKQKWTNRLASFGVIDSTDDTKLIYELANNASMNASVIQRFKEKYGLKETNNEVKKKEYDDYINGLKNDNQAIDIDLLENHKNDRFVLDTGATYTERQDDIDFKVNLTNQIDTLSIDDTQKSKLKMALEKFYDERTINSKPLISDFSLKMENNLLVLTSHKGQKTEIDINNGELVGFGHRFSDLSELLNAADLTNKILESQKGKVAVSYPPFQYKGPSTILENGIGKGGRGIYFNDAKLGRRNFDFDTRVLSGGWGGSIGKIDTLGEHPEDYAKYLSDRRMKINNLSSI